VLLAWPSGGMAGPEAKAVGATSISFALLAATLLPVQGEVTYWDTMLMWGTISSEFLRPTRDRMQQACMKTQPSVHGTQCDVRG